MSEARRALPGYDSEAKDIYETPDLTDSTSITLQSSYSDPESERTSEDDDEEDEGSYGLSRRRLYPEHARSRFGATSGRVDARGVDLSDRVDGRRRGYRIRRRRFSGGEDAEVEVEEEGLEARIARLGREIEECRVEAEERRVDEDGVEAGEGDVEGLSRLLAGIELPTPAGGRRRGEQSQQGVLDTNGATEALGEELTDAQTLTRVADFDTRLSTLEKALGICALDSTTADAFPAPVLPSITLLDQQLSALASATSLASLEATSSRIQQLQAEAEQLSASQSSSAINADLPDADQVPTLSAADMAKLQALYQLLPTLQSLAPTVPAMLERLRSLRALHTSAAKAASELDELERKQEEMDGELREWREGLERVKKVVKDADEANGRNGKVVQEWVMGLEARVKGLGR